MEKVSPFSVVNEICIYAFIIYYSALCDINVKYLGLFCLCLSSGCFLDLYRCHIMVYGSWWGFFVSGFQALPLYHLYAYFYLTNTAKQQSSLLWGFCLYLYSLVPCWLAYECLCNHVVCLAVVFVHIYFCQIYWNLVPYLEYTSPRNVTITKFFFVNSMLSFSFHSSNMECVVLALGLCTTCHQLQGKCLPCFYLSLCNLLKL